jgi:hypothetical protein
VSARPQATSFSRANMSSALRLLLGSVSWPDSMAELNWLIRSLTGQVFSGMLLSFGGGELKIEN